MGAPWGTNWFTVSGTVSDAWAGRTVETLLDLGFDDRMPGFRCEGLVHRPDGSPVKGLNPRNQWVRVGSPVAGGEQVLLHIEAASNPVILQPYPFLNHTFWWEGIDGTRIFTHFPPIDTYNASMAGGEIAQAARNFKDKGRARHAPAVNTGIGDAVRDGYRINLPERRIPGSAEVAPLVAVGDDAVVISAVKLADDMSGDVVVRLYESHGGRVRTRLTAGFEVARVQVCDLLERPLSSLIQADGGTVELALRPFELVTLRLARTS